MVALVTGASRGIGLAIAKKLRQEGHSVITTSRGINLNDMHHIPCNLNDLLDIKNLIRVAKSYGKIKILVNAAGVSYSSLLARSDFSVVASLMQTNLISAMALSQECLPDMISARQGCIVNISSILGNSKTLPGICCLTVGSTAYAASKAGMVGFTKALAIESSSRNIRVNAILPGFVETDMTRDLPIATRDQYLKSIPLKRFATCDEIADACSFIVNSNYMTGQCLILDGGLSI